MGIQTPTFLKYDHRDLSKNVRRLFTKGVFPNLREVEGRGAKKLLLQSWIHLWLVMNVTVPGFEPRALSIKPL